MGVRLAYLHLTLANSKGQVKVMHCYITNITIDIKHLKNLAKLVLESKRLKQ